MAKRSEKEIVYAYIKPINKKYLSKMSLDTNHPVSSCLDTILDSFRLNKEFVLKTRVLKSEEQLIVAKQKQLKKLSALEKKYKRAAVV